MKQIPGWIGCAPADRGIYLYLVICYYFQIVEFGFNNHQYYYCVLAQRYNAVVILIYCNILKTINK